VPDYRILEKLKPAYNKKNLGRVVCIAVPNGRDVGIMSLWENLN
jgi:hypothetical protein